ncbi:DUF3899 domain-containing protein [Heyndrickxia sporothermodurans]
MKKNIFIFCLSIILSFLIVFLINQAWNFIKWVNILFYIGMIYLLFGCVLIILRGNFFTAFYRSFKYFLSVISKKEQIIREVEGRKNTITVSNKNFLPSNPWIWNGLSFCIVSLILSLIVVYSGR